MDSTKDQALERHTKIGHFCPAKIRLVKASTTVYVVSLKLQKMKNLEQQSLDNL